MVKSATILLGSILTAMLALQIAANAASDIVYWDVGVESSGRTLWFGVAAVGLLMGGTILMNHNSRHAVAAFVASMPLLILYEMEHNQNYLSMSLDRSVAWWIGVGIVMVITLAWISDDDSAPGGLR